MKNKTILFGVAILMVSFLLAQVLAVNSVSVSELREVKNDLKKATFAPSSLNEGSNKDVDSVVLNIKVLENSAQAPAIESAWVAVIRMTRDESGKLIRREVVDIEYTNADGVANFKLKPTEKNQFYRGWVYKGGFDVSFYKGISLNEAEKEKDLKVVLNRN